MKILYLVVAIGIILLIIAGVIITITYEKPKEKEINSYFNITLLAGENERTYEIGYNILVDGAYYSNGTTAPSGFKLDKAPANKSLTLETVNLDNQTFYTESLGPFLLTQDVRAVFYLNTPATITANYKGDFLLGENVNVTAKVTQDNEREFRNTYICFDWSYNFYDVVLNESYQEVGKVNKWNKCYYTNKTIDRYNGLTFSFKAKEWGFSNYQDSIKIVFVDSDRKYSAEELSQFIDNNDKWGKNFELSIP
jgi:hypothetical protein